MLKQYGFHARLKRVHDDPRAYMPSGAVSGALLLLILGGGLLYALPERSEQTPIAAANNTTSALGTADDSLCDKQAWPYIDQRCAARVEAARGSRQVRIVTDKGTSVKTVTPLPVVEKKPDPEPAKPAVAQNAKPPVAQNDRPIGPA